MRLLRKINHRDYHTQMNMQQLWVNVLNLAFKDSKWYFKKDHFLGFKIWRRHVPALSWFYRKDKGIGSFQWVCESVGIQDIEKLRKKVLSLTISQSVLFETVFDLMGWNLKKIEPDDDY